MFQRRDLEISKTRIMGSKWRKVKLALGLNMCLYVPEKPEESSPSSSSTAINHQSGVPSRFSSDASSPSPLSPPAIECRPTSATQSSSGIRLSKSGTRASKVCLSSAFDFVLSVCICVCMVCNFFYLIFT